MIKLCEMLGGSHSYGLNTRESDIDNRFVFLNSNISQIIGLDKYEHLDIKTKTEDSYGFELRHFFNLLKRGNTQTLELLFNKNWITNSKEWLEIQENKHSFINVTKFYNSTKGYAFSERKLVNGIRKGQIGCARMESVKNFGYSKKNAVQAIRLLWAAEYLICNNTFPVNVKEYDEKLWKMLVEIKISPQNFSKEEINKKIDEFELKLDNTFQIKEKDVKNKKFDEKLANQLLLKFYLPILLKEQNENLR